ncbi:peroxiredoxin [Prosthecomicrobium pneumaticum]|uniref:thioredoxin-dependent peroxiredoxin n=1 Tax=Prosthecomicrobium pneumaticum TaxID=81895 RepID=A0A7W9FP08_9HYPH|nr:peroxiredoxin [Prosthecomicrobium pneumaticum]MBB5754155.1 peroxiredoxin Q/BCP [Prosthecomicrobium pneumaticum]
MAVLAPGTPAPDFELPADDGGTTRLADFRGRKLVLYFYPKDNTEGCTLEAIDFSRRHDEFAAAGAAVLGVSPDPVKSHARFRAKHDLTIPLASDEEKAMLEAYGVWAEKSMYGRKFMGVLRTTYLIDEAGRIARVWENVKVAGHADAVLEAVRGG